MISLGSFGTTAARLLAGVRENLAAVARRTSGRFFVVRAPASGIRRRVCRRNGSSIYSFERGYDQSIACSEVEGYRYVPLLVLAGWLA